MKDTESVVPEETAGVRLEPAQIVVPPGGLEFVTPEGRVIARLTDSQDGPSLVLNNPEGTGALLLGSSPHGGSVLALSRTSEAYAALGAEDGGGVLYVANPEGVRVASVEAADKGGRVSVGNNENRSQAFFFVGNHGGCVTVKNVANTMVAALGTDESGGGSFWVVDTENKLLFGIPAWKLPYSKVTEVQEAADVTDPT